MEAWVVPEARSSSVVAEEEWVGDPIGSVVGGARIGVVVVRHNRAVVEVEAGSSLCLVAGSWTWLGCPVHLEMGVSKSVCFFERGERKEGRKRKKEREREKMKE